MKDASLFVDKDVMQAVKQSSKMRTSSNLEAAFSSFFFFLFPFAKLEFIRNLGSANRRD
jgi:hypothetical protein